MKNKNIFKTLLKVGIPLGIGVLAATSFNLFFSVVVIDGDSMAPTFQNKDISVIYRTDPYRNKIVVFTPPKSWNPSKNTFIKRIMGEPGDLIDLSNNILYVNGKKTNHTIWGKNKSDSYVLAPGEYFVIGDNYEHSFDSLYMLTKLQKSIKESVITEKDIKFAGDSLWIRK